jgi:hypothetical protein
VADRTESPAVTHKGPLTREQLDAHRCPYDETHGPHPYLIAGGDCGDQRSIVMYDRTRGVLVLYCASCKKPHTAIQVAGTLPS